jgi:hypothetical protein
MMRFYEIVWRFARIDTTCIVLSRWKIPLHKRSDILHKFVMSKWLMSM